MTLQPKPAFSGSMKLRIFTLGFRWLSLILGLILADFNRIFTFSAPSFLANYPLVITGILLLYHLAASFYFFKGSEHKYFTYILIAADVFSGIFLSYYYGTGYFFLTCILPILETAFFFGSLGSLVTVLVLASIYLPLIVPVWTKSIRLDQLNILKAFAVLAVVILWSYISSLGQDEEMYKFKLKTLEEKNNILLELQKNKQEVSEVFNELERRQNKIQDLTIDLQRTKEEMTELYEDLHNARIQIQTYQKETQQKDIQLTQVMKREIEDLKKKSQASFSMLSCLEDLSRNLGLEDTLVAVVDNALKFFPSQTCILFVLDETGTGRELFAEVAASPYADYFRNFSLKIGEGAVGVSALKQEPVKIDSGAVNIDGHEITTLLTYEKSALIAPIVWEDKLLGVIYLGKPIARGYNQENFDSLIVYAKLAASALSTALKFQKTISMGINDNVTALYNNFYFNERLSEELKRVRRYNLKLSLILVEVDKFSKLIDSHGREVFDGILREIAEILRTYCRETDVIARLENDVLGIIFIQSDRSNAILIAERIRMAIEVRTFGQEFSQKLNLTASIGLGAYPMDAQNKEELLLKTCKALDDAKAKGGNNTCFP
ncbi:MAG: diguanylate cyclase [Firmicutes bacterium]|nr:diguanylate cyclase [Bacillota bacterium]